MPIEVHCDCGKVYDVGADMSGKKLRCKACGVVLKVPTVPLGESGEGPAPPPPPKKEKEGPGSGFEMVSAAEAEGAPTCPACGTEGKKGDAVCLGCGAELGEGGPGLLDKVPRSVLLGGGALVLVLIVTLVVWKVWYGSRDEAFAALGREKVGRGDYRGARGEFELALKYNAQSFEALEGLVQVGLALKDWRLVDQHAASYVRHAKPSPKRAQIRVDQARALLELRRPGPARDAARAALEDDSSVSGAEDVVGIAAYDLGEKEGAEEKLKLASDHGTKEPRVFVALARLQAEKQNLAGAIVWIHKAANVAPDDATIWLEAARYHAANGERAPARTALQTAQGLDKKNVEIPLQLARLSLDEKEWDQAKTAALVAKELAPDAAGPAVVLGEALLELTDLPGARAELERAVKVAKPGKDDEDNASRAELLLGRVLIKQGEVGPGIERLDKALVRRPKDLQAHLAAGELVLSIRPDQAARILEKALQVDKGSYEAHILLAQALKRTDGGQQRFAQRITELLREAIAQTPKRLDAYVDLGSHLDGVTDWKGAIDAFGAGLKEFPAEKELHYRLGRSCMRVRNWDRAIEAFEKCGDYKNAKDELLKAKDKKAVGE